ncbi:SRPBCC domain-containing protein [Methanolobus chelungpuianus]|uniref:Activator of Hsp90 ATPase homologue 1/2-like C-terminal domain-containing protein n=1 Tax=Methanolobus chelungpuianus TaxID=502115 RepID=A0AAE3H8E6_9EURY|nr:SRPBCC domain-containing protein [Methanolobus chelungpuianus]MCQ6961931.1 hypothetical protein [Methanolobus chelungpuianus]
MTKIDFSVDKEKLEVVMTHVFNAPRDVVWEVYTNPDMIPQWWGPGNMTTTVDKMEVKEGGVWRYIQKDEQGNVNGFHGVYKEVREPEFLSDTFNYEPVGPGHELTETLRLEEIGEGKTRAVSTSYFNSIEDMEGVMQPGMEEGAAETYDRFDKLLEKILK